MYGVGMNFNITVGSKVRFSTTHSDMSVITFSARVVKLDGRGNAWVEMPERVRKLPFPPLGGKRYGLYPISSLVSA